MPKVLVFSPPNRNYECRDETHLDNLLSCFDARKSLSAMRSSIKIEFLFLIKRIMAFAGLHRLEINNFLSNPCSYKSAEKSIGSWLMLYQNLLRAFQLGHESDS